MAITDEIKADLDAGRLSDARSKLDARGSEPVIELYRIQLAFQEGSVNPDILLQKLIELMRDEPTLPGATQLYQQISVAAYQAHRSSTAHSHPPPPLSERSR